MGEVDVNDPGLSAYYALYALKKGSDTITNRNITKAYPDKQYDNSFFIAIDLDAAGAARWEKMTERNVGRYIAFSLNDRVRFAPNVIQKIYGGKSRISMDSEEQALVFSALLTSEDLPLPVRIIQSDIRKEEKTASPMKKGYTNYILVFILTLALSFCVIWFIFKPGKNLSRNA